MGEYLYDNRVGEDSEKLEQLKLYKRRSIQLTIVKFQNVFMTKSE